MCIRDRLGCLRLYGDNRVSRAQPRINAYDVLLQHNWLLVFSWHDRFAETHSYLQLSYQITDRLLAAGNNTNMIFYDWHCSSSVPRPNSLWPESYRHAASIQPWNAMLYWLIIKCFAPYRQYFVHITALNAMQNKLCQHALNKRQLYIVYYSFCIFHVPYLFHSKEEMPCLAILACIFLENQVNWNEIKLFT